MVGAMPQGTLAAAMSQGTLATTKCSRVHMHVPVFARSPAPLRQTSSAPQNPWRQLWPK